MSDTRDKGRDPGELLTPANQNERIEQERPAPDVDMLRETVEAQIEVAQRVIDNWSSGDLASAANALEEVTEVARATLRDMPARDDERALDDDPDREPVKYVPMTPEQAANGLALRGLESETRDEMEIRHLDERTYGYATEEFPREMADRHAAELATLDARTPLSYESIERDHWNAVRQELPPNADRELLTFVAAAAGALREQAIDQLATAKTPEALDLWSNRIAATDDRLSETELHLAWIAPEFSRETIAADPWTAVDLKMPAAFDRELLEEARTVAAALAQMATMPASLAPYNRPSPAGPWTRPEFENAEAAAERAAELDHRLELARAPEIEIDPAAMAFVETREARGEFLSGELASNRFAEHASRVMDIVLETMTVSAESPWRPSPAELHDLMRARDEQAETRAVAAEVREHAGALDEANWHINHNRNHARTDDGARQAEDTFDRYPGLTQDAGADETRTRENDRAFYDTGIERGR